MRRRIIVFAMLLAMTFFWLPANSGSVDAQNRHNGNGNQRGDKGEWSQGKNRGSDWNRKRKNTYGYKNYGQYRRTQVGNRRYRTRTQYYTRNGIRSSRIVRIFY